MLDSDISLKLLRESDFCKINCIKDKNSAAKIIAKKIIYE